MKINFLQTCEHAFFSKDNKLSLIEIFDLVNVAGIPAVQPKCCIAINLNGSIEKDAVLLITAPSGLEVSNVSIKKESFSSEKENNNIVINFVNLSLPEFGEYQIILKVGEDRISPERKDFFTVNPA